MFKKLQSILTKKEIFSFFLIILFSLFTLLLEVISLTSIFPLLNIILEPDSLLENKYMQLIYQNINYKYFFDNFQKFILLAIISIFVIKFICFYFLYNYQSRYIYFTEQRIASTLYKNYLNQNYIFFTSKNSSTMINNMTNLTISVVITLRNIIELLSNYILIFLLLLTLLIVSPFITLLALFSLALPTLIIYLLFKQKIILFGKILVKNRQKVIQNIQQAIHNIKVVKLWNKSSLVVNKFDKYTIEMASVNKNIYLLQHFPRVLLELLLVSVLIFAVFILINYDYDLKKIIYSIGFFAAVSVKLLPAINKILISSQGMQAGFKSVDVLYKDLKNINKNHYTNTKKNITEFNSIIINNLSFKYKDQDNYLFENINIQLSKNKIIGLIGETGSGKSTFVDLILGLLKPNEGNIFIDENELDLSKISLNDVFGYVQQNPYLYEDTILNNILFFNSEINQDKINSAVKISQLHQYIDSLPLGLNTFIGENALTISGGQKQRISIARCLYNNPQLIILDEATNSVNQEIENKILGSLNEIKENKCILIVTHNVENLKFCDEIYEIRNKKIIKKK